MATAKTTFLCTVTLTCILLEGGRDPNEKYDNHQLWHALVVGSADPGTKIDNVQGDEFSTSIAFWERKTSLFPTKNCVAIVTGEAAFVSDRTGDDSVAKPALKIRASQVCVLPNSGGDGSLNLPRYTQPIFNLMGYAGAGQEHASGCRSFDLTCSVYNVETKQRSEFMVRCFFESGPRWKSYSRPRQGALVHAVGTLVGRFPKDFDDNNRPAILLTGYKELSGVIGIDTAMGLAPATPPSKMSALKLAPHGYTSPYAMATQSPKTPTRAQTTLARIAESMPVVDMSKGATSDSEGESPRTLSSTSLFGGNDLTTLGTSRTGVLAADVFEDGADLAARTLQLKSGKRRRVS